MPYPPITPLPAPPSRSQSPETFSADADAFLGALPDFQSDANALGSYLDGVAAAVDADAVSADADAAAAAASQAAAALSESNAAASEANAASSEANAAASEAAAAISEVNAAASELAAASSAAEAEAIVAGVGFKDVVFINAAMSPYTVTGATNGKLLACDTTAGPIVVNLPLISSIATPYTFGAKKTTSDANALTINCAGSDTFDDGTASKALTTPSGYTLLPDADLSPDVWAAIGFGGANAGPATSSGLTMSSGNLLGRTTAGAGAIEELPIASYSNPTTAGIAVTDGSTWQTSKDAPTGNIVGTNDVQTLTNKTIDYDSNTITGVAQGAAPTATTGGEVRVYEGTDNGGNYVALKAPASVAANTAFTLPPADGTSGQYLKTDGSGNLTFGTVAVSSGIDADPRILVTRKDVTFATSIVRLLGTIDLSSTLQVIFATDASDTYAVAYDSSTDTMGSPIALGFSDAGIGVYKLSSTGILLGTCTGAGFSARVLTVSGTTITANTAQTAAGTNGYYLFGDPIAFGSSYVFRLGVSSVQKLIAVTVSGVSVTLGALATISTAASGVTYLPIFKEYSASTGFTSWIDGSNNINFTGFSVSGTTITLGTNINTGIASVYWPISSHTLDNGKVICLYSNNASATYGFLISMSGTTVSQSYSAQGVATPFNGQCLGVKVGNSVLFTNGTNAVVFYDNSGNIAASSVATLDLSFTSNSYTGIVQYDNSSIMVTSTEKGVNSFVVGVSANAPLITRYAFSAIKGSTGSAVYPIPTARSLLLNVANQGNGSLKFQGMSQTFQGGQYSPFIFQNLTPVVGASNIVYSARNNSVFNGAIDLNNQKAIGHTSNAFEVISFIPALDKTAVGHLWYALGSGTAQTLYRVKFK